MITYILNMLTEGVGKGLTWALLAIGVYITFRILKFADLTAEGSFSLGGAVAATILHGGGNNAVALVLAVIAGGAAGLVTGLLHTKLKIPAILSGILTMVALYSINLRVMGGRPSISLLNVDTLIVKTGALLGIRNDLAELVLGVLFVAALIAALYWIFGTEQGSAIRATGCNENMCRALGISTDNTKITALILSNAIIALSGALVAQSHMLGDVNMGMGAIVIGLASVVIGEAFTGQKFSFWAKLVFVALGSVVYRLIVIFVINMDIFNPSDLKLLTAVVVIIALGVSNLHKKAIKPQVKQHTARKTSDAPCQNTAKGEGDSND